MKTDLVVGDMFLIVAAAVTRSEFLTDKHKLEVTLCEVARRIGMKAIAKPSVLSAINNPGLEGYLPIDASNITISTYTATLRLVACVHSCRMFDHRVVIACLREYYGCISCFQRVVQECDLEEVSDV